MQRSTLVAMVMTLMLGAGIVGYLIGRLEALPERDAASITASMVTSASPAAQPTQSIAAPVVSATESATAPPQTSVDPPPVPSPAVAVPALPPALPAEELARYRSEFLGRVSEALAGQRDVQIVGDRFVLQSDLLFPAGTALLQPAGEKLLAAIARQLIETAARIPRSIGWVLQVDGHTDSTPISNTLYPSNWELSTARAIAVVKFLNGEGVPNDRLVVAGYGQYRPLSSIDRARNRRIEIKLVGG